MANQQPNNPFQQKLSKAPGTLMKSGSLRISSFDRYTIKLKVTVYHNGTPYDLTPYIIQLKTHIALGEPSGRFTMLLSFQQRWDNLIQPQDYVVIQFGRYSPTPPVIMRGFVSNVRRTRMADNSGKVIRAVMINGENFGKLWREYQIQYLVNQPGMNGSGGMDTNPAIGLMYPLLSENFGIGNPNNPGYLHPGTLMQEITDKMLNAQIKALQQVNPQIPLLVCKANVLSDYGINFFQLNQVQGTAYSLIQQFANAPWCEFFIDDFSDAPIFFYRNTPFKKQDGSLIWSESTPDYNYFGHLYISDKDVIEEDVGHSDNEVYSYFFTYPNVFMLQQYNWKAWVIGQQHLTPQSESDENNISNPHVEMQNLYQFGFQMLQIGSNAIPATDGDNGFALALKMNQWLVNAFKWGAYMLNGTLRIKGNENMRIGNYVTNTSVNEEYYIESVDHEINITQTGSLGNDNVYGFQTTLGVTRGRKAS